MSLFRKNIIIFLITGLGVFGLLNVSVQFGRIIDFFPDINMSMLLAEEITETENETGHESSVEVELYFIRDSYVILSQSMHDAVEVYLHSISIPIHPAHEKVTPPPKA